jgi:transcriptional regulator with XRE-family HTH domain
MITDLKKVEKNFNPNRKIGQFLAYLRTAFGISSQPAFAKRLNVSRFYLSNIESGRTPIKFNTAWDACEILDIHPDFLISTGKNNRLPFTAIPGTDREKIKRLAAANPSADFISFWPAIREVVLNDEAGLTDVSERVNIEDVKPKLPNLMKRLEIATAQRGKKSELAKFLGVSLVQVSQWLSGNREPGGETTLKMLHWVEAQERNK